MNSKFKERLRRGAAESKGLTRQEERHEELREGHRACGQDKAEVSVHLKELRHRLHTG